jgi:hypothetical protein
VDHVSESHAAPRPLVVCPLAFERRALARANLGDRIETACCGPGAEAVVRFAERLGQTSRLVVLAGLAGGLNPLMKPGQAFWAATVIDHQQRQFRPTFPHEERSREIGPRVVIVSTTRLLASAVEKREFSATVCPGADLVDLESGAFALAATLLGWRWGIVRGVSDPADMPLPRDIARWVTADGRTRPFRAAASLALRPWDLARMRRLARHSRAAMHSAALRIAHLV